jgi:hypothetical protein
MIILSKTSTWTFCSARALQKALIPFGGHGFGSKMASAHASFERTAAARWYGIKATSSCITASLKASETYEMLANLFVISQGDSLQIASLPILAAL